MSAETAEARILADLLKGRTIHSTTATERYGVEAAPVIHRLRRLGTRIAVTVSKASPNVPSTQEWRIRPEHLTQARATAQAHGIVLGNLTPCIPKTHKLSQEADEFAATIAPILANIKAQGTIGPTGIARELNRRGIKTRRGSQWNGGIVSDLLNRLDLNPSSSVSWA